jgi:hypothetical protein
MSKIGNFYVSLHCLPVLPLRDFAMALPASLAPKVARTRKLYEVPPSDIEPFVCSC